MKKALIAGFVLSVVLFLFMGVNYIGNERMIKNYNNGIYKLNSLDVLGIFQPYVAPYNRGNIDFQLGNYDEAILYYEKALKKRPPEKKECKIRINMALAMVAGIDFDNLNKEDVDETIQILENAIGVLVEKNCANEDHQSGHSEDAQQLEIELSQLIEALQNSSGEGDDSDPQNDGSNEKDNKNKPEQETQKSDLQQKFEEQQRDVQKERNDMYEINEIFKMDFDFSDEPVW